LTIGSNVVVLKKDVHAPASISFENWKKKGSARSTLLPSGEEVTAEKHVRMYAERRNEVECAVCMAII